MQSCGGGTGVFGGFDAFFALLRVIPELSASFWSPRRRRVLCHRGLPACVKNNESAYTFTTNLPWSQRRRHGRVRVVLGRTGSGVEASAEFIMNEPSDEFFRHAMGMRVGGWSGCGGGGAAVAVAAGRGWLRFVLRFVLFFDVVVDVPVVQVVDVGSSSSWTRLSSCPLLCKTGVMVQTVQPIEFRSCSSCGCGRPCDEAATSWGLPNSESASDSVHRAV